jgi:hypothetical protein
VVDESHDDHDVHDDHGHAAAPLPHAVGAGVNVDPAVHGHDSHDDHESRDVTPIEWISWLPLLALIVVLGVVPNLLFKLFDPAVDGVTNRLVEYFTP